MKTFLIAEHGTARSEWEIPHERWREECGRRNIDWLLGYLRAAPYTLCHQWDMDAVSQKFRLLRYFGSSRVVVDGAVERYADNRYSFATHPLPRYVYGLGHDFNDVSNAFQEQARLLCGGHNIGAPEDIWRDRDSDPTFRKRIAPYFFREANNGGITMASIRAAFRLAGYTATQFRVQTAKSIYDDLCPSGGVVFDPSMGWGDRLAGFFASRAAMYVGADPSLTTWPGYERQAIAYTRWLDDDRPIMEYYERRTEIISPTKHAILLRQPAEEVVWSRFGLADLVFTSPPYFSTERYDAGSEAESDQSWSRYPDGEAWFQDFLAPTLCALARTSRRMVVNLRDAEVGRKRVRYTDRMVKAVQDATWLRLAGVGGLRMKGRPSTLAAKSGPASSLLEPLFVFAEPHSPVST